MIEILAAIVLSFGLFWVLADLFDVPYYKSIRAVKNVAGKQRNKNPFYEVMLGDISDKLSKKIHLDDLKKSNIYSRLLAAGFDVTPERFVSDCIIKAISAFLISLPICFLSPILFPLCVILGIFIYGNEKKKLKKEIDNATKSLERDLLGMVLTIGKLLSHTRDVLYILSVVQQNAGKKLKRELEITIADMRSGSYEKALIRLETRTGSQMMSDVCRGLISVINGDDTTSYWERLETRFTENLRDTLYEETQKIPRKVRRLTVCLLLCFMTTYIVVIGGSVISGLNVIFA